MPPIAPTSSPTLGRNPTNATTNPSNATTIQAPLSNAIHHASNTAYASLVPATTSQSSASARFNSSFLEQLSGLHATESTTISADTNSRATKEQAYLQKLHTWTAAALREAPAEEQMAIKEAVRRIEGWVLNQPSNARLMLNNLGLKMLPELPDWLVNLNIKGNALQTLPNLSSALEDFDASDNRLRCLPPLPIRLCALDANNNCLTTLPDLPGNLDALGVRNNHLSCLPQQLPLTLNILLLEGNPLTSLPEMITDLPSSCVIDLGNVPLPIVVRQNLQRIVSMPDYQGPRFYFSRNVSLDQSVHPLKTTVACWYPDEAQASISKTWAALQSSLGAADFSRFLDRLRDSIHFQYAEFKATIRAWLDRLSIDTELRELTFAIAQEGIGSCEDRTTLTFNAMQQAQKNLEVERGEYDNRLDALITLGRAMFRLGELEKIARNKAASLRLVDEIEVYLAYQVKLRQKLVLPIAATDMRFFDASYVTQDDLDAALLLVQQREASDFFSFLANDWAPWQAVLKRLTPEAYDAAQQRFNEAVAEEFITRQNAFLQANGLPSTEYQLIQTAPAVLKAIADEIKGKLTQVFLAERRLVL